MNGVQHGMSGISTYPFKTFSGNSVFQSDTCSNKLVWDIPCDIQIKGDTIIGNDVWIGYNVTNASLG